MLIPSPEMLGAKLPDERKRRISRSSPASVAANDSTGQGIRWQLKSQPTQPKPKAEETDLSMDGSVEIDPFENFDDGKASTQGTEDGATARKPAAKASKKPGDQLNWRPVKSVNP